MVRVAVLRSDRPLGRRVVARLASTPGFETVGIGDATPPDRSLLDGVDALVRLPGPVDRPGDDHTHRWYELAGAAGVAHLVHVSTAAVYGARPDNPLPLREDAPLRAGRGIACLEREVALERRLASGGRPTTPALTVLRPSIVVAEDVADRLVEQFVDAPRFPAVTHHRPPLQFVHADDLAGAVVHVVADRVTGTFNVSAEGWLSFGEVTAILGRRIVELPEEVALEVTDRTWSVGIGVAPAAVVHYLMHPWVVDVSALIATGWTPTASNRDAVASLAAAHHDRIAVGPIGTRRSVLVRAAAALAGAVAALTGGLLWRRWRAA